MKKYTIFIFVLLTLFGCTKESPPVEVKDYINGLFTAEVNKTTFTTQKQKTGDIVVPIGYFGVTITVDQYSSSYVSILARFDEKNSCHLMFRSNKIADPNEVRIESNINDRDNYHKGSSLTINSVRTSVTRIIVNHPRGNIKSGSYEMYNGSTLLCKGQFSSE
jgi:hypothetical protein